MTRSRTLALRKETLHELTQDDLLRVVGGAPLTHAEAMTGCGNMCLTEGKPCGVVSLPLYECVPDATAK